MTSADQRNRAGAYLRKAQDYLASAEDNLAALRPTPAAGDAIHAGISAKDAIVTALTGETPKGRDHRMAAQALKSALGGREDAQSAAKSLRELLAAKNDVEYGTALMVQAKAEPLVRRARSLVALAEGIVRLGR